MMIDTTCPHCSKPANSIWSKLNDTGLRARTCNACRKSIQLDIGPVHFILMIFWILPAMWLPRGWQRLIALIALYTAMVIFRAWHYKYKAHFDPITFDA